MAWVVWGEDPSLAHRQWLELNKLLGSWCSSEERQGAQSEQKNPVQELSHSLNFSLLFFFQNLQDEHQQAAPGNTAAGEHVSDVRAAELQGKLQHSEAANKVFLHEEYIQC